MSISIQTPQGLVTCDDVSGNNKFELSEITLAQTDGTSITAKDNPSPVAKALGVMQFPKKAIKVTAFQEFNEAYKDYLDVSGNGRHSSYDDIEGEITSDFEQLDRVARMNGFGNIESAVFCRAKESAKKYFDTQFESLISSKTDIGNSDVVTRFDKLVRQANSVTNTFARHAGDNDQIKLFDKDRCYKVIMERYDFLLSYAMPRELWGELATIANNMGKILASFNTWDSIEAQTEGANTPQYNIKRTAEFARFVSQKPADRRWSDYLHNTNWELVATNKDSFMSTFLADTSTSRAPLKALYEILLSAAKDSVTDGDRIKFLEQLKKIESTDASIERSGFGVAYAAFDELLDKAQRTTDPDDFDRSLNLADGYRPFMPSDYSQKTLFETLQLPAIKSLFLCKNIMTKYDEGSATTSAEARVEWLKNASAFVGDDADDDANRKEELKTRIVKERQSVWNEIQLSLSDGDDNLNTFVELLKPYRSVQFDFDTIMAPDTASLSKQVQTILETLTGQANRASAAGDIDFVKRIEEVGGYVFDKNFPVAKDSEKIFLHNMAGSRAKAYVRSAEDYFGAGKNDLAISQLNAANTALVDVEGFADTRTKIKDLKNQLVLANTEKK